MVNEHRIRMPLNDNGNPVFNKDLIEKQIGKRIRLKVFNHFFNDVKLLCETEEITNDMIKNINLLLSNHRINKSGIIGRLYTYYTYVYLLTHERSDNYPKRSKFVKKLHVESIELTEKEVIIRGRILEFGWVGDKKWFIKLNEDGEIETIKDYKMIEYIRNRNKK